MGRIVTGTESGVVIQRHKRARRSGRVVETVGGGDRARITKMVEVNEMGRRIGIAERAGSGGGGRNGGQTPVAGSRLLGQDTRVLAMAGSELDITQEGCSIYVTIQRLLYAKEMTFKGKDGLTSIFHNLTNGSVWADSEYDVGRTRAGGSKG